ncbi:MAG TPA: sulfite exporter TauE/SafE family protein [Polyangiaceae bacterium]|nr:sulfite exporter TauE/SafE family protein [Polyangiaceae bacterium]
MTICLIVALSACIGIAAGLLGAGTSILTVLLLVHVAGLPIGSAIATSLVVVAAMSAVALVPYSRARAVMWKAGAAFSVSSMIGAFVGGRVSTWLPARALLAIFATTMVGAAVAMLWSPRPPSADCARSSKRCVLTVAAAGLPLGGLTGMVGLGGGFAVLPLLVLFTSTPLSSAVGTTLLVVAMNTLAGLAGHFPHAAVEWRLAAGLSVVGSAGSLVGARLGKRIDARVLRRAFAAVMLGAAFALLVSSR